jgi:hypothetical protein
MPLTNAQADWNKEVDRELSPITKVKGWLNKALDNYPLSWEDRARLTRAQSFLELAVTELETTKYRDDKEVRMYKRHEIS